MLARQKIQTRIKNPRVLVIDDEVQLAELLRAVLESAGLEVCVLYDAADAWQKISEFRPDIILSDVRMPEMRGDELLAVLRQSAIEVPVIFLTGVERRHISVIQDGQNPFLILYKPVPHEVLIQAIEKALHLLEERMINAELLQRLVNQDSPAAAEDGPAEQQEIIRAALDKINSQRSA